MSNLKRKAIPTDPPTVKHIKARPRCLQVRLPKKYESLLPDLLLLDVPKAEYVQQQSLKSSYLYAITACILDRSTEEIELYATKDGTDAGDDELVWSLLDNDDHDYESGVYVCHPLSGIRNPYLTPLMFSELNHIWVEKLLRGESSKTGSRANTPATTIQASLSEVKTPQAAPTIPSTLDTPPPPSSQLDPSSMPPPPSPAKTAAPTNSVSSFSSFTTDIRARVHSVPS